MKNRYLQQRSHKVLTHLVNEQLKEARKAAEQLEADGSVEALHELRVAARRLRSMGKSYFDVLPFSQKSLRYLREITEYSNQLRDLEVQQSWVSSLKPRDTERAGVEWLAQCLQHQHEIMHTDIVRQTLSVHHKMRKHLKEQLEPFERSSNKRMMMEVLEPALKDAANTLGEALQEHRGQAEELHQARILGKRLRYLFEPFSHEFEHGNRHLKTLKTLQDMLGQLHDLQIMSKQLPEWARMASGHYSRHQIELALDVTPHDPQGESLHDPLPGLRFCADHIRVSIEELSASLEKQLNSVGMRNLLNFFAHIEQHVAKEAQDA